jgi:transposase InsO family protein
MRWGAAVELLSDRGLPVGAGRRLRTGWIAGVWPVTGPTRRGARGGRQLRQPSDFACVDTVTLRRYHLLFFIDIPTRRVFYAGATAPPTGEWTTQAARNLLLRHGQSLERCKALVRDRGSQFTAAFDEVFRTEDIKVLKTPGRTPVANAFAERWIRTLRRELLDRTLVWNRRQLERIVIDYTDHYNAHRPHRSLGQRPPEDPDPTATPPPHPSASVLRSSRCDGLIHEYRNAA